MLARTAWAGIGADPDEPLRGSPTGASVDSDWRIAPSFELLNTWYYSDAPRSVRPHSSSSPAGSRRSRRSPAASTSRPLSTKPAAACPAGTASRATTAMGFARQRGDQARQAGRALRNRLRLLQGLRYLRRGMSVRRDRDSAGNDLTTRGRLRSSVPPRASPSRDATHLRTDHI